MITYHGPAQFGWKPFGGLGQVAAPVILAESPMPAPEKRSPLPKIVEVVALMAAGALALYMILIFTGDSAAERRTGP